MPRPRNVAKTLERNVASPPTATPMAAMVPMSIFLPLCDLLLDHPDEALVR
jgi:hypothetical protein